MVAAYPVGVIARMVRAQVLDTLGETHVQMLRSLGFPERTVFGRFAMKLAWNPVAAVFALVFAYSLVNSFLVESIFDWPGLGSYATASVETLDTPAIVGVTLFIGLVYVAANLRRGPGAGGARPEDQAAVSTLLARAQASPRCARQRERTR